MSKLGLFGTGWLRMFVASKRTWTLLDSVIRIALLIAGSKDHCSSRSCHPIPLNTSLLSENGRTTSATPLSYSMLPAVTLAGCPVLRLTMKLILPTLDQPRSPSGTVAEQQAP